MAIHKNIQEHDPFSSTEMCCVHQFDSNPCLITMLKVMV